MKEHFKGVIWPRGLCKESKPRTYRYVIVGMLVTDEPISEFEGKNELLLDGPTPSNFMLLGKVFRSIKKRKSQQITGDATNVLLNLGNL